MKITKAADYAIQFLVCLAVQDGGASCSQVAEEIGVPFNHLAKLVQRLSRNGFVTTSKGKGGGVKLAHDPNKINLAEVVEAVEGPIVLSDCILNRKTCKLSKRCKLRPCLSFVQSNIRKMLANSTIADLAAA